MTGANNVAYYEYGCKNYSIRDLLYKKLQRVLSTIAQAFYRNNNISLRAAVDDTLEISIEMP